jgi:type I restriction enzyme M protein
MRIQTSIKHHGFLMPLVAIKENDWDLSINRYKEMVHEEVVYVAPKIILNRNNYLTKEPNKIMSNLNLIA